MRKVLALSLLAVAALATVGGTVPAAVGQEPVYTVESDIEMTPMKAGTQNRPRGIELDGQLRFTGGPEWPVITGGRVLLPRGIAYNGDRYPKCSAEAMRGDGGAGRKHCLKLAVIGTGRTPGEFADRVITAPKVVFVNGGARRIWAYTTLFNPAFVQEPVAIAVERRPGPRWGYELSFEVPANLQVVAGVPISIPSFNFSIGGKEHAPRYFTTNGGCPTRGFRPYEVSISYRFHPDGPIGTSVDRGRLACR